MSSTRGQREALPGRKFVWITVIAKVLGPALCSFFSASGSHQGYSFSSSSLPGVRSQQKVWLVAGSKDV